MKGSIISSLFPATKVYDNLEKSSIDYKAPIWNNLPKIIWVYADSWEEKKTPSLVKFFMKFMEIQNKKKGF